jgi:hypothetical protein
MTFGDSLSVLSPRDKQSVLEILVPWSRDWQAAPKIRQATTSIRHVTFQNSEGLYSTVAEVWSLPSERLLSVDPAVPKPLLDILCTWAVPQVWGSSDFLFVMRVRRLVLWFSRMNFRTPHPPFCFVLPGSAVWYSLNARSIVLQVLFDFFLDAVVVSVSSARSDGDVVNPLNAELNPICYLLELLGAHPILHVSWIRVKTVTISLEVYMMYFGRLAGLLNLFSFYIFRAQDCNISFLVVLNYSFRYSG